jgi:DNA-directed RNA polymerase subunit K/omega
MLYPTITELTKDEFNRYELALATAKCARIITDEYVAQKVAAEEAAGGNKETERALINNINKEYRDEKAVKNAITKIHSGEYTIVRTDSEAEATTDVVSTPEVVAEEAASDE